MSTSTPTATNATAARRINLAQATLEAMDEEMARDPRVFLMGEDIARQGGVFGQFKGLSERYGLSRVRDTPVSETALVGTALGAALAATHPPAFKAGRPSAMSCLRSSSFMVSPWVD